MNKPWGVFGFTNTWGLGFILEDNGNELIIKEDLNKEPDCWCEKAVKRFGTFGEAFKFFCENYNNRRNDFETRKEKIINNWSEYEYGLG